MSLLLFLTGNAILFIILILFYVRKSHQANLFKHQLIEATAKLEKSHATDQALKRELTTIENKLEQTNKDSVTGLLGRQLFEDRLNQNIKESARYQFAMGILFIDIDNFKVINDALGYEVGDALLAEVARVLQTCVRQVDSVSRFTKDTFVVLLTQLAKPETAAIVTQRMLQALSEPFQIKEHELYITVCIGIALFPSDGQDATTLLRNADYALHLAKQKGKHVYQFYQEKMHAQSQRELTLYTNLGRESIFSEFVFYYQPIVNVEKEMIICMDALLHWQQPEFGLIPPQELFNLAERQRKLNIISEWLIRNACKQFLHWRSLGFNPELIGVPLSIAQLENSHFIYRISQILQELEMKPACLLLEIKESMIDLPIEVLEKSFNMLKYMGVNIAVDNFGSGSFSLGHLKSFTIQFLKLDPSLVTDINENPQAVALIKSLVVLAESLSMQVIAQGLESEEQVETLKKLGCVLMQGKPLGAPLTEQEVTEKQSIVNQK